MIASIRFILLFFASVSLLSCTGTSQMSTANGGPTAESLSHSGSFQIRAYTSMPDAPEYADATIYYPINTVAPIGGVVVAPGFTERQRHINWWGSFLATHGYAVLILDSNDVRESPEVRALALMAGVRTLREENQRRDSPLFSKLDTTKTAIMGHSMGGGGVLLAANAYSNELSAAIPLTPWQPDGNFGDITVPTLIIAGEVDSIAPVADHAWPHYQSLATETQRAFLELKDGDHFIANSAAQTTHPLVGRYALAWLKLQMDGDERYRQFFSGKLQRADSRMLSRYELED